jgi:hypothetical protein
MLSEAKHLHYLLEKKQMRILRFAALRSEFVTFLYRSRCIDVAGACFSVLIWAPAGSA